MDQKEHKDITQQEAEYAGYVDRGTQVILQEAVQKIVETFSHTDALEDILGYLEGIRENLHTQEERLKEMQQKDKVAGDKLNAMETSVRNLLQRVANVEVQIANASAQIDKFSGELGRLTKFFEKGGLARMFSKLPVVKTDSANDAEQNEEKK